MRKLSCLVVALITLCGVYAQEIPKPELPSIKLHEYKKFKVSLGLGYAMPGGEGGKAGVLLYIEPAYRIIDYVQVGFKMELAAMARGFVDTQNADVDVQAFASYTVNGQYYLTKKKFRPFTGAGFGIYTLASSSVQGNTDDPDATTIAGGSKFGFYPRAGFDLGHFTFYTDYNAIPATGNIKNNYTGFHIAMVIGGGKK